MATRTAKSDKVRQHAHSIPDSFYAAPKPYLGILFTNTKGGFSAISVTERKLRLTELYKVQNHISDRSSYYTYPV